MPILHSVRDNLCKELGNILAQIPAELQIPALVFYAFFAQNLGKDEESVRRYVRKGVPARYLMTRFPEFEQAVIATIDDCLTDADGVGGGGIREDWEQKKEKLLIMLRAPNKKALYLEYLEAKRLVDEYPLRQFS